MLEFFIKRRTLIGMLFVGLFLTGYISYRNLDLELLPNIELPFLIIQINSARDMDPGFMERQAIVPLEEAVGLLEGIEKIESTAQRRQGRIMVFYNSDVNIKYAYLRLQETVDAVKQNLPEEFFVNVFKIDTDQLSNMFMNLQIRGTGGVDRLRHIFEDRMRQEFESIDGIANVEIFGGREKSVEIIIDQRLGNAYNLTPARIRNLIVRNNQEKVYLGRLNDQQKQIHVNLISEYRSIHDLERIVVDPSIPLYLKDVAEIRFDVKEETSLSRINGMDAVTVQLVRDTRTNLIELSHETRQLIDKLNGIYNKDDIGIVIQQDSAEFLEDNIDLIKELALLGGLIAVIILWYFLGNIRLVFIIGLALPISVFTAFNLFYAAGITLNSLTLVGMALAVGMLVDNSIVVLENIYRHYQVKRDALESVTGGTREIWRSILAATLTTVTVFLPFLFAENFMMRILGYQIGVSIISTLLVSLVIALMLIPMVVYYFLSTEKRSHYQFQSVRLRNRLVQIYMLLLKSAMRFPLRTTIGALVLFFASIIIAFAVSVAVQEEQQTEDFNLYVTMPSGSTLESTDLAVKDLEERLTGIDEVRDIISQIYEEEAILTLVLKEEYEEISGNSQDQIKGMINDRIDEFRTAEVSFDEPVSSERFRGGGGDMGRSFERLLGIGGEEEQIIIKGEDYEIMRRVADDIAYQLEERSSIERVRVNVPSNRPEIHLLFDKKLLNEYEISLNALATGLAGFQKEISTGVSFKQEMEEYDILIRTEGEEEQEEKDYEDLRTLPIESNRGQTFPLHQISSFIFTEGRGGINRVNQERQIEISYRFIEEITDSRSYLEASRAELDQIIAGLRIPTGIAVERIESEQELSEDSYFLIAMAALLIYMILASVFESFLNPFIIMFTIPLAAIGSFWAIIFTGSSLLNANTLIGFLILLGIVVNNGIILIDYTRVLRKRGFRRSRALMVAGKARLRPIIITALTTIAAMMPLALGRVEYVTSIAAPFAITVIGGLSLSTIFTLVLIPTVYSGLETLVLWIKSLDWRLRLLQGMILVAGAVLIYFNIDSLIWKFVNLFVLLFIIPGATYFILHSLRRAREHIVEGGPLTIRVRNIYKIYDQPARFAREWAKGRKLSQTEKSGHRSSDWAGRLRSSWKYVLLVFLFYFIYFYLKSNFWIFVLVHFLYFYMLHLLSEHLSDFQKIPKVKRNKLLNFMLLNSYPVLFWGWPALNLIVFHLKGFGLVTIFMIGALWYFALTVYTTSNRLTRNLVNINRLKGRFAGIRRRFYRLIQHVPVIGKKRVPFRALNGVSLEIGQGMFGLLGPNGAGKTTLMRIICGILHQSYGTVHINNINAMEKREELQGLIGYLPQEFGTYENLTAREFLSYQAILKGLVDSAERKKRIHYVISAVHMEEHIDQKIGSFSGGMKQRTGIAQTLLHLPRILVVDEPTAGLDPRERIRFRNLLVELSRERIVIFSTHIIEDIASSCDRVAILNHGKIKYLGAPVKMNDLAQGNVWQCLVDYVSFETLRKRFNIVHHIKFEDKIRIRVLADRKPLPEAISVNPTLEDAYLWLLGDVEEGKNRV